MARAKWKLNFVNKNLTKKNLKKVWNRNSVIGSNLINKAISIYNGKEFKNLLITREHIGYKFGEFIITRRFTNKIKDTKDKSKLKKKVTK